mmetsp:Transcript_11065/g.23483  ORF Transcript_11065/g.23483 Transcript_11065/m.23483 type:complete len:297 (+) Transcript_11065:694-1584(+)
MPLRPPRTMATGSTANPPASMRATRATSSTRSSTAAVPTERWRMASATRRDLSSSRRATTTALWSSPGTRRRSNVNAVSPTLKAHPPTRTGTPPCASGAATRATSALGRRATRAASAWPTRPASRPWTSSAPPTAPHCPPTPPGSTGEASVSGSVSPDTSSPSGATPLASWTRGVVRRGPLTPRTRTRRSASGSARAPTSSRSTTLGVTCAAHPTQSTTCLSPPTLSGPTRPTPPPANASFCANQATPRSLPATTLPTAVRRRRCPTTPSSCGSPTVLAPTAGSVRINTANTTASA